MTGQLPLFPRCGICGAVLQYVGRRWTCPRPLCPGRWETTPNKEETT